MIVFEFISKIHKEQQEIIVREKYHDRCPLMRNRGAQLIPILINARIYIYIHISRRF